MNYILMTLMLLALNCGSDQSASTPADESIHHLDGCVAHAVDNAIVGTPAVTEVTHYHCGTDKDCLNLEMGLGYPDHIICQYVDTNGDGEITPEY